ncbi:MAG: RNA polymerase sigma factor [Verrucomicrobiota bacterium]
MKSLATATLPQTMDRVAFSRLVLEHHRPLLAYARVLAGPSQRAEEIVQDTFVAAWQAVGKFDITRDFGAWLRGIARNKWKDQCRMHRREIPLDEETLGRLEEAMHRWSGPEGEPELLSRLADCRRKLPDLLAQAVREYYFRADDGDTAAEALGIPPATLRKRLERARQALRQCLENHRS